MFKELAKLGAGRRHVVPEAVATQSNDNRSDRVLAAASKRARPQGLTCHWRAAAAGGRLECHWQVEPADEAPAEAPGQSCTTIQMQRLLGTAWRGQSPIRAAVS